MTLQEKANEITQYFDADGVVIIIQKKNDLGQLIAVSGLEHLQVRECLSIAIYYNEKIELDTNQPFL